MTEKATFGAGCFWGVEVDPRNVPGVKDAAVGYMRLLARRGLPPAVSRQARPRELPDLTGPRVRATHW